MEALTHGARGRVDNKKKEEEGKKICLYSFDGKKKLPKKPIELSGSSICAVTLQSSEVAEQGEINSLVLKRFIIILFSHILESFLFSVTANGSIIECRSVRFEGVKGEIFFLPIFFSMYILYALFLPALFPKVFFSTGSGYIYRI